MATRVLIVEDDHATQLLLQAVMAHNAIPADLATDGATALRKLAEQDFAAIVLDLLLPVTSGFEILRSVKNSRPHLMSRVVVITAAADAVWRGCAELELVHCVMRKPLDIDDLVGHVRDCMAAEVARGGRQA